MREPEPLVPKPRQNTGHLPAADTVTGVKDESMARCSSEVSRKRSGRAESADDEISVRDRRSSVSPQLLLCREVDSIGFSASDWFVEMSCSTVCVCYAGYKTQSRWTTSCVAPFQSNTQPYNSVGRLSYKLTKNDRIALNLVHLVCFAYFLMIYCDRNSTMTCLPLKISPWTYNCGQTLINYLYFFGKTMTFKPN